MQLSKIHFRLLQKRILGHPKVKTFPKKLFWGKMNAVTDKGFLFLLET